MSLINEALKRTRDNLPAHSPADQPYQVRVAPAARRGNRRTLAWWLALGGGGALTVILVVILASVSRSVSRVRESQAEVAVPVAPPPPVVPAPAVEVVQPEPVVPAPVEPAPPPPPPEPPKLVLQGITMDAAGREVMINGQTLRVGDSIDEAVVVTIEPRRVALRWGDRDLVLRMP
jgi:hypothetical protein